MNVYKHHDCLVKMQVFWKSVFSGCRVQLFIIVRGGQLCAASLACEPISQKNLLRIVRAASKSERDGTEKGKQP